jgi:hypothetical protein
MLLLLLLLLASVSRACDPDCCFQTAWNGQQCVPADAVWLRQSPCVIRNTIDLFLERQRMSNCFALLRHGSLELKCHRGGEIVHYVLRRQEGREARRLY